jgi:hypothetical protein
LLVLAFERQQRVGLSERRRPQLWISAVKPVLNEQESQDGQDEAEWETERRYGCPDCWRNCPRCLADGVRQQALNYLQRLTLRLIRTLV